MQGDIVKLLGPHRPKRVVTDFDRENLIFISKKVSREAAGNYIRAYCPPMRRRAELSIRGYGEELMGVVLIEVGSSAVSYPPECRCRTVLPHGVPLETMRRRSLWPQTPLG